MSKKSFIITGVILFLGLISYFVIDGYLGNQNVIMLNEILSRIDGFGEIRDYDDEIEVHSINDIGYKYEDETLYIKFGRYEFKLTDELKDKEFVRGLHNIGIDITKNKEGTYRVYYKGQAVQELYH